MSDRVDPADPQPDARGADALAPLPGEAGIPHIAQRTRPPLSRKGLLALGLLIASLASVAALSIHRFGTSAKKSDDAAPKALSDKPAAAGAEPRKLELPPAPAHAPAAASPAAPSSAPRIPALVPTAQELSEAEPIGVRRATGPGATPSRSKPPRPEDAPVMLVTSRPPSTSAAQRAQATSLTAAPEQPEDATPLPGDPLSATARNLDAYQRQLQGLLDTLNRTAALAGRSASPAAPSEAPPIPLPALSLAAAASAKLPSSGGLFTDSLQGAATPRVAASSLGPRSLTLPKGTAFTCALETRIISAASGLVACQVQRNVYSDDGRVLLIERGSHLDGEYRVASLRAGSVRIPVLWTRLRTPHGVTVDLDSPATGPLGEAGIDGYVDNRWGERIGAALLLSLIDDSVKLVIANQASERGSDTVVLQSTTDNTSKLAEKVLDSTIHIAPLIYRNQGGIVGIVVARDIDFSPVYALRPTPAASAASAP